MQYCTYTDYKVRSLSEVINRKIKGHLILAHKGMHDYFPKSVEGGWVSPCTQVNTTFSLNICACETI
jgi:hypothetical protein